MVELLRGSTEPDFALHRVCRNSAVWLNAVHVFLITLTCMAISVFLVDCAPKQTGMPSRRMQGAESASAVVKAIEKSRIDFAQSPPM